MPPYDFRLTAVIQVLENDLYMGEAPERPAYIRNGTVICLNTPRGAGVRPGLSSVSASTYES
ncbi:MAG TPA: hypothetical protein VJX67_23240, partial [Blastocatellia bacterium]|nr:hypothetical protein [Blastocatellia bacterium]